MSLPYDLMHRLSQPGTHAFIEPVVLRAARLRVVHIPAEHYGVGGDGERVVIPALELAPADWKALPDGEFAELPFLTSNFDSWLGGQPGLAPNVMSVLQAFMDLGHSMGLTPTGMADRSAEVAALRYHLEDMRKASGMRREEQPPWSASQRLLP